MELLKIVVLNRIQHIFLVFVFILLSVRVLAFSWADSVGNEPFVPQNAEKLLVNDSLSFAADSSSQLAMVWPILNIKRLI